MNELNKLYKAMLLSWGAVIKDTGRIMFAMGDEEHPIRIDDMDMYLPLTEVLDNNCLDKVFFHPACENITSKETEVFKIIRKMTSMKLLDTFRKYPIVLFSVASAKEKKAHRQDVLNMLEPLKQVKRSVRDELSALFARMHIELEEDGLDNRFIHFKVLKSGGRSATGEKTYYKTKPSFPFYNEIIKRLARSEGQSDNQTLELNNFTVSIAALKLAAHLFQVIIPAVLNPDDYEFEATSPIAARLVSYLGCYSMIVDQLNRVQNTFRADFDKMGIYLLDTNWTEHLENLPDIYRQVPMMDYNSHNTQEEAVAQQVSRNSMGGLLSVTSQQQNSNQQQQNNNNNNQPQQQQQRTNVGDFDTTIPQMQSGDQWVRTEIDYGRGFVLHFARNPLSGAQVIYECTRQGNLLQRTENNPSMMGMNGMGGMMNMMGMMNGMNNGMGGGQVIMTPQGPMYTMPQQPVTAANSGGSNNGYFASSSTATF